MALRALEASTGALNIAASLCGIPFVGAIAIAVEEIVKTCGEVKTHKVELFGRDWRSFPLTLVLQQKSKQLSNRCIQILNTLNEQTSKMEGSKLQQIADQLLPILEKVLDKTRKWSKYNSVVTFLKNSEIRDGLDLCDIELNSAMTLFHINSNIIMHSAQCDMMHTMRSNTAELSDLLLRILTVQSETRTIIEMQNSGQPVAEQFMRAGQQELSLLRQADGTRGVMYTPRTASPTPHATDSQRYLQYQRGLITLHRETGIPPTIKVLNGEVTKYGDLAIAGGVYSDIWAGKWLGEEKVALKALRNIRVSDPKAKKRFENEINLWANLKHSNILPFYGIVTDLGQHIHMVSPWQENGNVLEFVKTHRDANRISFMAGAAQGLEYLHLRNIIHGNMKCANILVSAKGEARICDFGMSKVIEEVTEKSASAALTEGGSARWLAPELIEGKSPSKAADTYSFAMALLELLTGKYPFADCKRDATVIRKIVVLKQMPARPKDREVWEVASFMKNFSLPA
ncbi:unnamed protein product [Cyclocybe aegerita]|uniref:Protein kinase domain-containing protein n=1 Tax=Cyclocybe aegerita TaxID=1973307 RepID=A0A8S0W9S1_CYCAE|nr:unnamed protein product [Cyclocybe aegerita]